MHNKRLQIILVILCAFFLGYFIGNFKVHLAWSQYKPQITIIDKNPPAMVSQVDFSQFWNVWDKVVNGYYDKSKVDPQKMLQGAISGMVGSLGDPYTMYLPPAQQTSFSQQLAGQFTGIGAELGLKDKQIIVVTPLVGSPAKKAGIQSGDAIVKVNGEDASLWTLPQAVEKIRGPKGTQVTLTVVHKDDTKTTDITITRDVITIKSIDGWLKPISQIDGIDKTKFVAQSSDKIMYLRLSQFGDNTNQDWSNLIGQLAPQFDGAKGIILDLRNNPGGYVTDAQYIASEFLPQGDTVVIQQAGNGDEETLTVNRAGKLLSQPLVILINKGSASASEIVAGAMRDNNRAKLIGEVSFGKGTMQQAIDLGQGAGLHVTIAKWLTPNGTWVHGKGLTPDIAVDPDTKDMSHDTQLEAAIGQLLK